MMAGWHLAPLGNGHFTRASSGYRNGVPIRKYIYLPIPASVPIRTRNWFNPQGRMHNCARHQPPQPKTHSPRARDEKDVPQARLKAAGMPQSSFAMGILISKPYLSTALADEKGFGDL